MSKKPEPKKVKLYHKTGVTVLGAGYAGPDTPVEVDENMGRLFANDETGTWSLTPFTEASSEKGE